MTADPPVPPRRQVAALLSATLATQAANLAQTTVLGLVVYERTGSEFDLGLLGLAEFTPAAVLVLVAGAVVDRFDRRRVAALGAGGNAVVALVLAWYLAAGHRSVTPIFALVLAFGVGQAFLSPAQRSLPAAMVPDEVVPWLVARASVASEVGTVAGPVLGGLLYDVAVWVPMVAVAGCSALAAAAISTLRLPAPERRPGDRPDVAVAAAVAGEAVPAPGGGWHEALEGLRFVRAQSILLGAISLDLFAVLLGGAVTLLPAIAVRLHAGAVGLGWLRAAVGLGAGATTVVISWRPIRRRVGRILLTVVALFGAWTIVLGLTRSYDVAFVAVFALSAADAVSMVIRSTLVPLATPPEMRGRVLAVENVFIGASNELGGFESGALGQLIGTTGSVVVGGIGTLVVALAWGLLFRPLGRLDRFPAPPGPTRPAGTGATDRPASAGRTPDPAGAVVPPRPVREQ